MNGRPGWDVTTKPRTAAGPCLPPRRARAGTQQRRPQEGEDVSEGASRRRYPDRVWLRLEAGMCDGTSDIVDLRTRSYGGGAGP